MNERAQMGLYYAFDSSVSIHSHILLCYCNLINFTRSIGVNPIWHVGVNIVQTGEKSAINKREVSNK